jgi:farnesyl-diphosphate farnesyltransferase
VRGAIRSDFDPAAVSSSVDGGLPAERELLGRLPEVLAACRGLDPGDRTRGARVLLTLTGAMVEALERFPPEKGGRVGALETRADLDRYTYTNAGCVGEYWTDMVLAHRPRCARRWEPPVMRARGIRFGQGLQLVNVLRDLPRDLRIGRCYLPRVELAALEIVPEDLLDPKALARVRPLLDGLIGEARACLADGLTYTLAVPRREWRLRLACAWPLLIGLATLDRLARSEALLDPGAVVKVPRAEVRGILGRSAAMVGSDRGLRACAHRLTTPIR